MTLRFRTALLLFVGILVVSACARRDASATVSASFITTEQLFAQDKGESEWRKTRFGWVDSSGWHHPARVDFERRVEIVHPLVFSALLILISVAVLIWASEEYQWSRLVQAKKYRQSKESESEI